VNDDLDRHIDDLAREYRVPPEPPVDLMWARIQQRRAVQRRRLPRWGVWVGAVAAVLVAGIGIGRLSAPESTPVSPIGVVSIPASIEPTGMLRLAADAFLRRSEVLLTEAAEGTPTDAQLQRWATRMLGQTRLFQDTELGKDPQLAMLLLDLEFVFAEIAQSGGDAGDGQRIARHLSEDNLMLRVRNTRPAETARADARGGELR
jgi:hypothetical protein